jgi:predicted dithiol-disulfide oxidoreductase (DUF899 family)
MPTISTASGNASHPVVSREEWLQARQVLLQEEKALFRAHDALKAKRRALPWVRVDKPYEFDGAKGKESLATLFAGHHQLLVYHFMFAPENDAGCPHCSFWADHYDGPGSHLGQRDTALVVISRAPFAKLDAFKRRMGWKFKWVSSGASDFNYDFNASFTPELIRSGRAMFNFAPVDPSSGMADREGLSAFYRDDDGAIYHTYSTFARGIDLLNTTYNFLDLTAKGRDEHPDSTQDWVRYHDRYPAAK